MCTFREYDKNKQDKKLIYFFPPMESISETDQTDLNNSQL